MGHGEAQKQCSEATERLLRTEDRWNRELDKMKESYETQVNDLRYCLNESEKIKTERAAMLDERQGENEQRKTRVKELEVQLEAERTRYKDYNERIESERRRAKEFETKYQTIETLFDQERVKMQADKDKMKIDMSELKKKLDDG